MSLNIRFVFVLVLTVTLVSATIKDTKTSQYCGRTLNNILKAVCDGIFQSPFGKKRSDHGLLFDQDDSNQQQQQQDALFGYDDSQTISLGDDMFMPYYSSLFNHMEPSTHSATAIKVRHLRSGSEQYYIQRGIVDECCRKPCTFATLRSYCSYK